MLLTLAMRAVPLNFTELDRDTILNIELRPNARLEEVVVTARSGIVCL